MTSRYIALLKLLNFINCLVYLSYRYQVMVKRQLSSVKQWENWNFDNSSRQGDPRHQKTCQLLINQMVEIRPMTAGIGSRLHNISLTCWNPILLLVLWGRQIRCCWLPHVLGSKLGDRAFSGSDTKTVDLSPAFLMLYWLHCAYDSKSKHILSPKLSDAAVMSKQIEICRRCP